MEEKEGLLIRPIAHIRTPFPEKFGIPRQSGRVEEITGRIEFLPAYRNPDALRRITEFSHLWLLFDFSEAHRAGFTPTVRPPRLGGNERVGVFASRSPFRPNPIGLSAVRLLRVEHTEAKGDVLIVAGADLLDGTPIFDIKPYLPFADSIPEASGGYAAALTGHCLRVDWSLIGQNPLTEEETRVLTACLAEDPRPSYQEDGREYKMRFSSYDVAFTVEGDTLRITSIREES